MARVPLFKRGLPDPIAWAEIDDGDWSLVCNQTWRLQTTRLGYRDHHYACSQADGRPILMHRLIMATVASTEYEIDHINGDGLDNHRRNLRVGTHAQNMQNQRGSSRSTSRFRGVSWDARTHRWRAKAELNGREYWIGRFVTEVDAGEAAAQWRAEHMPYSIEFLATSGFDRRRM